jgi:hypothetical protein
VQVNFTLCHLLEGQSLLHIPDIISWQVPSLQRGLCAFECLHAVILWVCREWTSAFQKNVVVYNLCTPLLCLLRLHRIMKAWGLKWTHVWSNSYTQTVSNEISCSHTGHQGRWADSISMELKETDIVFVSCIKLTCLRVHCMLLCISTHRNFFESFRCMYSQS